MNISFPTETLTMNIILNNTRKFSFLILLSLFFTSTVFSQSDLSKKSAIDFLKLNKELVCQYSQKYNQEPHSAIAFGYPKLVEFFEKKNSKESERMENLYIHLGSRESDIQIGEFLLKTSFVEQLETIVNNHSAFFSKFTFLSKYDVIDERSIRQERITRMKDLEWQIDYLFAFKAIADSCFFGIQFQNMDEKNAFYSIAFDLGFKAKLNDIKNCYAMFMEVETDRRVEQCEKSANLTKEFLQLHSPLFDCKDDFVKIK